MTDFVIDSQTRQQVLRILQFAGDVVTHRLDFNPWADDNGTVTSVTWTVESGSASIAGSALSSNTASTRVTTTDADSGIIKAVATDGTRSKAIYIYYVCKDPSATTIIDYS